jgi:CBS domain-containing protein
MDVTGKIIPDVVDNQTLYKLPPSALVREAAKTMGSNKVSAVLVTDGDRLVGIFTERDLTARVVAVGLDPDKTPLSQVMTARPDVLAPEDSPLNALELMRLRHYRHLPVVEDGRVVGMVSIRDLYAVVKKQLEHEVREREAFIFDTGYGVGA